MITRKSEWPDILKIGKQCIERYIHNHSFGLIQKKVVLAGISDLKEEYQKSRPGNSFHTILYTIGGSGYFKSPEIEAKLKKGDVLILPKDNYYEFGIEKDHWQICWFHLANASQWRSFDTQKLKIKKATCLQPVQYLSECLFFEQRSITQGSNQLIQSFSDQIITYLNRELEQIEVPGEQPPKQRLIRLFNNIENQLQFPWTVELLSQKACFSAPHFYTLCKKHLKSSPMKYLTHLRMTHAQHLLSFTNISITSISIQVGYENMFNFSKAFKKSIGLSPSDYRKQVTSLQK